MPDLDEGVGEAVLFDLWEPPIFKNLLSSDIEPCLLPIVDELSSCMCERLSLCDPNKWVCLFSGGFTSTVLREDLGRLIEDELGGRCFPRALNLNRWSMASRFFD